MTTVVINFASEHELMSMVGLGQVSGRHMKARELSNFQLTKDIAVSRVC